MPVTGAQWGLDQFHAALKYRGNALGFAVNAIRTHGYGSGFLLSLRPWLWVGIGAMNRCPVVSSSRSFGGSARS